MIIGDAGCPKCIEQGRDKTRNHLMLFDDGGKYCNRCGYREGPGVAEKPVEEITFNSDPAQLERVKALPIAPLELRGIREGACKKYRVRVEYSEATREQVAYYFPLTYKGKLWAYKKKILPKTYKDVGNPTKGVKLELFGQDVSRKGGRKLLITEGLEDCLAAYQMLQETTNFEPVVVATGGVAVSTIANNLDFINSFQEVLLCFDQDDAGKKMSKEVSKLISSPIYNMQYSEKDPNDMLLKGKSYEFKDAFYSAKPFVPDGIITIADVYEDAIKMPEWGRRWPWPSLDAYTYGRRDGEGIYVGAGVKSGKTLWLAQMVHYIVAVENKPVFLIKFEQSPALSIKEIAGKIANKVFTRPDGDFTQQDLKDAVDALGDNLRLFDASFSDVGKANMWDRLKPAIRHDSYTRNCKDFFIDPITQLTDGLTASETETELRRFSNEIQGMAQDLGFFYYCFAHLKEPATGKTHEEGGLVKVAQFRGSRAMAEKTKLMLGIERNQMTDDEDERNTSTFRLLLNSGFGKTGSFKVKYDWETGSYLEVKDDGMY